MMKGDSAILTGYLFRHWPACVHVPNWKTVLCLCVWHFANWKNVMCHWKNVLRVSAAIRCVSHVRNSYDKVTLIFDNKVNLAALDLSDSSQPLVQPLALKTSQIIQYSNHESRNF